MVPYEVRPSRQRMAVALAVLCALVPAAAGCGGDDKPAVCDDLEQLSSDIDTLQAIDLTAGEGAIADLEASLEAITTDLADRQDRCRGGALGADSGLGDIARSGVHGVRRREGGRRSEWY